jgi:polyhydroxyalkanoate synthase
MHTRDSSDKYIDPDTWMATNEAQQGSWWPAWNAWLDRQMSSQINPPRMGAARKGFKVLRDAPGNYVFG